MGGMGVEEGMPAPNSHPQLISWTPKHTDIILKDYKTPMH